MSAQVDVLAVIDVEITAIENTKAMVDFSLSEERKAAYSEQLANLRYARAAVAALIAERDALLARLDRPASEDEERRALEFLAAEYERDGKAGSAEHIRTQPEVDDARMARALEAARCGLAPEHVSAIEEAIAAYDPNCGARTVRVVDDANGWKTVPEEPTREMIDAGVMFGTSPNKACMIFQSMLNASPSVAVVDDAMVDAAIAAQDAHWANDANYPARAPRSVKGDAALHDKLARGAMRAALTAALARAQGVQP